MVPVEFQVVAVVLLQEAEEEGRAAETAELRQVIRLPVTLHQQNMETTGEMEETILMEIEPPHVGLVVVVLVDIAVVMPVEEVVEVMVEEVVEVMVDILVLHFLVVVAEVGSAQFALCGLGIHAVSPQLVWERHNYKINLINTARKYKICHFQLDQEYN
jgi:hypothetical protein